MDILINENQKRFLVVEGLSDNLAKDTKKLFNLTKSIINQSSEQLGMNLQFMLTWGASIGGIMAPLMDYVNGNYPELDTASAYSLVVGAVSIVFYNNEKQIRKIAEVIEEKGLNDIFVDVLENICSL